MRVHLLIGVLALVLIGAVVVYVVIDSKSPEAEATDETASAEYPGEPVTGEPVKTASGLMYYDLKVGDGPSPAGPTSMVRVRYTGWLKDGTKFESSDDHDGPSEFELNRVIAAWTEGVGSMKVGGKRKLIVPYQLGYGERGSPPKIPPRAMLIFDVELLALP